MIAFTMHRGRCARNIPTTLTCNRSNDQVRFFLLFSICSAMLKLLRIICFNSTVLHVLSDEDDDVEIVRSTSTSSSSSAQKPHRAAKRKQPSQLKQMSLNECLFNTKRRAVEARLGPIPQFHPRSNEDTDIERALRRNEQLVEKLSVMKKRPKAGHKKRQHNIYPTEFRLAAAKYSIQHGNGPYFCICGLLCEILTYR